MALLLPVFGEFYLTLCFLVGLGNTDRENLRRSNYLQSIEKMEGVQTPPCRQGWSGAYTDDCALWYGVHIANPCCHTVVSADINFLQN